MARTCILPPPLPYWARYGKAQDIFWNVVLSVITIAILIIAATR